MTEAAATAQMLRLAAEAIEHRGGDEDVLNMTQAAEMVNRGIETLRYWRKFGGGPPSFKVGRRVMYRRGAVRAWLAEQEAAGE